MLRRNWTKQQDTFLRDLVSELGKANWTQISTKLLERYSNTHRSGKQCRQRWYNHLDPNVNKHPWTYEESLLLFEKHRQLGNRWKQISVFFPGRTDNNVKNHFYSTLRRSLRRLNKIIGEKNSTSQMREIKPSVLTIILDFIYDNQADDGPIADFRRQLVDLPKLIFEFAQFKPVKENMNAAMVEANRNKIQTIFNLIQQFKQSYYHEKMDKIERVEHSKDRIDRSMDKIDRNRDGIDLSVHTVPVSNIAIPIVSRKGYAMKQIEDCEQQSQNAEELENIGYRNSKKLTRRQPQPRTQVKCPHYDNMSPISPHSHSHSHKQSRDQNESDSNQDEYSHQNNTNKQPSPHQTGYNNSISSHVGSLGFSGNCHGHCSVSAVGLADSSDQLDQSQQQLLMEMEQPSPITCFGHNPYLELVIVGKKLEPRNCMKVEVEEPQEIYAMDND